MPFRPKGRTKGSDLMNEVNKSPLSETKPRTIHSFYKCEMPRLLRESFYFKRTLIVPSAEFAVRSSDFRFISVRLKLHRVLTKGLLQN